MCQFCLAVSPFLQIQAVVQFSSPEKYVKIQSLPQRKHNISSLQK
jgi:hypothetical protein